MNQPRKPIRPDRLRKIPQSFSWIDREILGRGILERLTQEEILLYFFLVLVAGPEGTSFWGYPRIGKILKLSTDEICAATRGLVRRDLVAFKYPTFQVLSLPDVLNRSER
jgi:hypothetical protein